MKTKHILYGSATVFLVPATLLFIIFLFFSLALSKGYGSPDQLSLIVMVFGSIGLTSLWVLTCQYKKYATNGIPPVLAIGLTTGVLLAIYLINKRGFSIISDPMILFAWIAPIAYLFIVLASIYRNKFVREALTKNTTRLLKQIYTMELTNATIPIFLFSAFIILYVISFIPIIISLGGLEPIRDAGLVYLSLNLPSQVLINPLEHRCGTISWLPIWTFQALSPVLAVAFFVSILFTYSKKNIRSLVISLIALTNLMFLPFAVNAIAYSYGLTRYCG